MDFRGGRCRGAVSGVDLDRVYTQRFAEKEHAGKDRVWREVVPFWTLAFIGLGFSTWTVALGDHYAKSHFTSHLANTLTVLGANLFGYGVLWIIKFIIFNKVIFVHHQQDLEDEPAWDGRTGLPT